MFKFKQIKTILKKNCQSCLNALLLYSLKKTIEYSLKYNILMKFILFVFMKLMIMFDKTPLRIAIENNNIEIVKLLLSNDKLDFNIRNISI